jgi:hypothetical protein
MVSTFGIYCVFPELKMLLLDLIDIFLPLTLTCLLSVGNFHFLAFT